MEKWTFHQLRRPAETGGQYSTGAPAAMRVAHDRIRTKMAIDKLSAKCAKQACESAIVNACA